jgi:hypothetical protein
MRVRPDAVRDRMAPRPSRVRVRMLVVVVGPGVRVASGVIRVI